MNDDDDIQEYVRPWRGLTEDEVFALSNTIGAGGVAVYGQYHGKDPWWTHWAPLPVKPKENT